MWSPDGRRFYYVARSDKEAADRQLMEVDVRTSPEVGLGVPRPLFSLQAVGVGNVYSPAPGAERFLMVVEESGQTAGRLVLVQNWFEEFRHATTASSNGSRTPARQKLQREANLRGVKAGIASGVSASPPRFRSPRTSCFSPVL